MPEASEAVAEMAMLFPEMTAPLAGEVIATVGGIVSVGGGGGGGVVQFLVQDGGGGGGGGGLPLLPYMDRMPAMSSGSRVSLKVSQLPEVANIVAVDTGE